jgi:hypothetical protein
LLGEFEFCSREGLVQGAPVCWRFWARGPGYPYGILELGSCPSWQGGNKVWAVFDTVQQRTTRSTGELASGRGNLIILLSNSYAVDKILIFLSNIICSNVGD